MSDETTMSNPSTPTSWWDLRPNEVEVIVPFGRAVDNAALAALEEPHGIVVSTWGDACARPSVGEIGAAVPTAAVVAVRAVLEAA